MAPDHTRAVALPGPDRAPARADGPGPRSDLARLVAADHDADPHDVTHDPGPSGDRCVCLACRRRPRAWLARVAGGCPDHRSQTRGAARPPGLALLHRRLRGAAVRRLPPLRERVQWHADVVARPPDRRLPRPTGLVRRSGGRVASEARSAAPGRDHADDPDLSPAVRLWRRADLGGNDATTGPSGSYPLRRNRSGRSRHTVTPASGHRKDRSRICHARVRPTCLRIVRMSWCSRMASCGVVRWGRS